MDPEEEAELRLTLAIENLTKLVLDMQTVNLDQTVRIGKLEVKDGKSETRQAVIWSWLMFLSGLLFLLFREGRVTP